MAGLNMLALPEYKVGGQIDWSPIGNAIDSVNHNALMGRQLGIAEKRNALMAKADKRADDQFALTKRDSDYDFRMKQFKGLVGLATAAEREKDPARRQAYLDRALALHPDRDNIEPQYRDPVNGPRLIIAEASNLGPEEMARMRFIDAQTANQWAEARARGQKSQMDDVMARLIGGMIPNGGSRSANPAVSPPGGYPSAGVPPAMYPPMSPMGGPGAKQTPMPQLGPPGSRPMRPPPTAPGANVPPPGRAYVPQSGPPAAIPPSNGPGPMPQQPGGFQRQSYGQPQQQDPNFILTQAGSPPSMSPQGAPQPGAPGMGSEPDVDVIDTPLGPMPADRARRLGMAFALGGKGDAGKMLADSVTAGQMGKEGRNKLDKDLIDTSQRFQRLRTIKSSMDPKYLEIPTRLGMQWKGIKAKFGGLPQEEQGELYKYATFRRDAAQELNELVKERSGGAVTPQEFERQGVEIPNAGNGIFDGDDPVTFQAKLDRAYEVVALGFARNAYLRKADGRNAGRTTQELSRMLPIEQFRSHVNQRAQQLEGMVQQQNPGLPKPIVNREVDRLIKQEFGI